MKKKKRKEGLGQHRDTERSQEKPWEAEGTGVMGPQAREQEFPATRRSWWGGLNQILPQSHRRNQLSQHLDVRGPASKTGTEQISVKLPSRGGGHWEGSPRKQTQPRNLVDTDPKLRTTKSKHRLHHRMLRKCWENLSRPGCNTEPPWKVNTTSDRDRAVSSVIRYEGGGGEGNWQNRGLEPWSHLGEAA